MMLIEEITDLDNLSEDVMCGFFVANSRSQIARTPVVRIRDTSDCIEWALSGR